MLSKGIHMRLIKTKTIENAINKGDKFLDELMLNIEFESSYITVNSFFLCGQRANKSSSQVKSSKPVYHVEIQNLHTSSS